MGFELTGYPKDLPEVPEDDSIDYGPEPIKYQKIWSVNLFSPSDVQKYGRGRLLSAPCEQIEEWGDGAIFMMIHKDSFSSTYGERKKLREYLNEPK